VGIAWPADESGVVLGRYLQGRDQAPRIGVETVSAPSPRFVDRGGLVLRDLNLWLIYWGSGWAGHVSPTATEVTEAVKTVLGGNYFSGLSQYRGIRRPTFKGAIAVTDDDPPNSFSNAAVTTMIYQQLLNGALPEPDDNPTILYCVVLPPGIDAADAAVVGEHSFFVYYDLTDLDLPDEYDIARAHYAWVTNEGTLDSITTVLSHALVESCTDPDGGGIQGVTDIGRQGAWSEIGDVCEWSEVRDGVRVQAYWSEVNRACVVPGSATGVGGTAASTRTEGAARSLPLPTPATAAVVTPAKPSAGRGWAFASRYVGGLLTTAWMLPIAAAVIAVAAYVVPTLFPPDWKLISDSPVLAGVTIALVAWLLLAAFYSPMSDARHANGSSYADLQQRLCQLEARITAVPAENRTGAFREAMQDCEFIATELGSSGIRWVTAIGYIALWERMHRAEEALIEIEPRSQVVADALEDQWRLQDSTVDHSADLLAELKLAREYLVTLRVADTDQSPAIHSETEARAVVGKVRLAIDDFRDKRRAALVRTRNLLMATMIITELFAFAILALAISARAPREAIIAAVVFYLVGALVGLFNRLSQQVGAENMVEDFALAGVRLVLTPTLSGLAAVGGVVLTGMLTMSGLTGLVQPSGSSGAAAPTTLPVLADIFDLNRFRIGLLIAALFGGTPAIFSSRLQQLTEEYKKDLKSTDPSSPAPTKKP